MEGLAIIERGHRLREISGRPQLKTRKNKKPKTWKKWGDTWPGGCNWTQRRGIKRKLTLQRLRLHRGHQGGEGGRRANIRSSQRNHEEDEMSLLVINGLHTEEDLYPQWAPRVPRQTPGTGEHAESTSSAS